MLSTLETEIRETACKLCFQLQPAPLHIGNGGWGELLAELSKLGIWVAIMPAARTSKWSYCSVNKLDEALVLGYTPAGSGIIHVIWCE